MTRKKSNVKALALAVTCAILAGGYSGLNPVYAAEGLYKDSATNLKKLGIPEEYAYMWGNTRLGYWRVAGSAILDRSITREKLVKAGYYELASNYELKRLKHYGI